MPERKKDNVALMKMDERSEENVVYSDEKRNCPSGQFHFNIKCCLLSAERGRKMYEIGIDMGGRHTAGKKRIIPDGHFLHRHGCAGKLQYADGND